MDQPAPARMLEGLRPEERLLWHGKPSRGLKLRHRDLYLVPVGIYVAVLLVATLWEIRVDLFSTLQLVMLGSYYLFLRFFADHWRRKTLHYGLTDKRIIFLYGIGQGKIKSFLIEDQREITIKERPDHSGTIYLSTNYVWFSWFSNFLNPFYLLMGATLHPSLEFIADVRTVFGLILEHQYRRDF